jgi:hypothetical protein
VGLHIEPAAAIANGLYNELMTAAKTKDTEELLDRIPALEAIYVSQLYRIPDALAAKIERVPGDDRFLELLKYPYRCVGQMTACELFEEHARTSSREALETAHEEGEVGKTLARYDQLTKPYTRGEVWWTTEYPENPCSWGHFLTLRLKHRYDS